MVTSSSRGEDGSEDRYTSKHQSMGRRVEQRAGSRNTDKEGWAPENTKEGEEKDEAEDWAELQARFRTQSKEFGPWVG